MIRLSSPKSDPAAVLCLTCQAGRRWQQHVDEHGTPPDPADFLALWPHADFYETRTILTVLAHSEGKKRSCRLGILCDCTVSMRQEHEQRVKELQGQESVAPAAGNGTTVPAATQHPPVPSVPHFSRRWRHLAAACIGLVVVIGGAIGWDEFFNIEVTDNLLLDTSGQYAELVDEWEAGALQRIEDSVVMQDGIDVVSFDFLDEATRGMLSLAGLEGADPVDADVARDLLQTYHDTVRGLVGKTEAEVLAGLESLSLELGTHPSWAWLKYATHPAKQSLLNAARLSTDTGN